VNQVPEADDDSFGIEAWHTLVHVVFGSPRRLDLRLFCTEKTPFRETLAIWPPLLIVVRQFDKGIDNIMAVLEHNDRVCEITLWHISSLELEEVLVPMQKPYLTLTDLAIWWRDDHGAAPIVPGWICTASAISQLRLHSISGITKTTFVGHSPRYSRPSENSKFRILHPRGDRPWSLHVE
jgi:hypothetical protein